MAAPPAEASATASPEPASAPTRVEAMREKIKAGGHDSPYRLRKQLPEPVFGQIKQARGFRQFLLRGLENVQVGMEHGLRRPQFAEAGSAAYSVRYAVHGRPSKAVGCLKPTADDRAVKPTRQPLVP